MTDRRTDRRDSRRRFDKARRVRRSGPRHSARGSVLILVVAMLVILALMGTAYLAAARLDRADATGTAGTGLIATSAAPAQMDSILRFAEKHAEHRLVGDLVHPYDANNSGVPNDVHYFRPPAYVGRGNSNPRMSYEHFEDPYKDVVYASAQQFDSLPDLNAADVSEDAWLAARIPTGARRVNEAPPTWAYITSWPPFVPFGSDNQANVIRSFSSPLAPQGGGDVRYRTRKTSAATGEMVEISSVRIEYPTGFATPANFAGRTRVHPALRITDANGQTRTYLAADADGDGVADSGLFEVRDAQFGGDFVSYPDPDGPQPIRYFVAMRIVDNNSAININTARSVSRDWATPGNTIFDKNLGIFRANVGVPWEYMDSANANLVNAENAGLDAYRHNKAGANSVNRRAVTDNGSQRSDFEFVSEGDALESQLARRLANPGYNDNAVRYRAFGRLDQAALAYRGTLMDPMGSLSDVENSLEQSVKFAASNFVPNNRYNMFRFYGADQYMVWYHQNYNFDTLFGGADTRSAFLQGQWPNPLQPRPAMTFHVSPVPPVRSLLTTMNPVSNAVPVHDMSGLDQYGSIVKNDSRADKLDDQMPNWPAGNDASHAARNTKANVNSANFGELWRAYWAVMSERSGPNGPLQVPTIQGIPATAQPRERMFRSSVRGEANFWDPYNQLVLRAALAAVNTIDLCDSTDLDTDANPRPITGRQVQIGGHDIAVFGTEPQPYLTEVYAYNDKETQPAGANGKNPEGYVAIELVNPFPETLNLNGWQVWRVDRGTAGSVKYKRIHTFNNQAIIPAGSTSGENGYLVLENFLDPKSLNSGAARNANKDAHWRPKGTGDLKADVDADKTKVYFVSGLSEVLVGDGTARGPKEFMLVRPVHAGGDTTPAARRIPFAPVDSFDFHGFPTPEEGDPGMFTMRSWHYVRANKASGGEQWHFVYPGPYRDARDTSTKSRYKLNEDKFGPVPINNTLDVSEKPDNPDIFLGGGDSEATYRETFPIQLANVDWAGGNKVKSSGGNKFPFGGFARNGDILKVPFIGSYIIHKAGASITADAGEAIEINPVTMDAFYAEHKDLESGSMFGGSERPEIGRFCPDALSPAYYSSYNPASPTEPPPAIRGYEWAGDLFDYLTVQSPKDDYLPNVDPRNLNGATPVANGTGEANQGEDHIGVEGLVNINTAPWQVLAMLPLVVDSNGDVDRAATVAMARDIVEHRERFGPFRTIFDLNKVKGSTTNEPLRYAGDLDTVADPGITYGDMDPLPTGGGTAVRDRVVNDFEHKYIQLTRLSNLITTRSDTFTVYILVQAWQNPASTGSSRLPVLLGERRSAFVVDRSQLNRLTASPREELPKVGVPVQ